MITSDINDAYVMKQIRRTNRNLVLVGVFILLAMSAFLVVKRRYVYNFVFGPFQTSPSLLAQIESPEKEKNYFVRIAVSTLWDIGYVTEQEDHTQDHYFVAFVSKETEKEKIPVILKVSDSTKIREYKTRMKTEYFVDLHGEDRLFEGELQSTPKEIQQYLKNSKDTKDARQLLFVDTTVFRNFGYGFLVFLVPLVFFALYLFLLAARRSGSGLSHPAAKFLSSLGSFEDMVMKIESELQRVNEIKTFYTILIPKSSLILTKHWLLGEGGFALNIVRFEDVVWIHKTTTKQAWFLSVYDRFGRKMKIECRSNQIDAVSNEVALRCPLALLGYDEALAKKWISNSAEIIADFDTKKRQQAMAV